MCRNDSKWIAAAKPGEAASGGSRGGGCAGEYCRRRFTSGAQNAKHWACLKRGNDEILSLRVWR